MRSELALRKSIHRKQWKIASEMLSTLSSGEFILPSGRNIVFVVSQTCAVGQSFEFIVPLLSTIGTKTEISCDFEASENDIIPALDKLVRRKCTNEAVQLVEFLEDRGVQVTAKAYALLIFACGRSRNEGKLEQVMDRIAAKGIVADTVLLNSVLDAYIRCGDTSGRSAASSPISRQNEDSDSSSSSRSSSRESRRHGRSSMRS